MHDFSRHPRSRFPSQGGTFKELTREAVKGEENISKIEDVSKESIGIWIIQVLVHKHLLEESLSHNTPKVKEIESQLPKA